MHWLILQIVISAELYDNSQKANTRRPDQTALQDIHIDGGMTFLNEINLFKKSKNLILLFLKLCFGL